jgi:type II secretory pathway pseudopilin PulG
MTARASRAGITLTEILISILIMGVGLVSLATLFPVGLERIRRGQRDIRSAQLLRSSQNDVQARNLFGIADANWSLLYSGRDPWVQDTPVGSSVGFLPAPINSHVPGDGLPVAFDPLWWAQVNNVDTTVDPLTFADDARFGRYPLLTSSAVAEDNGRNAGTGPPGGYGLQRLTTIEFFHPDLTVRQATLNQAASVFASLDDPVLQTDGRQATEQDTKVTGTITEDIVRYTQGSPILPFLELKTVTGPGFSVNTFDTYNDWTFTWMFTGKRVGLRGTSYVGDVVVFHNRPFGFDSGSATGVRQPAGERVVEAVFAHGSTITIPVTGALGYSPQDRTVLLRWPSTTPDPDVRIGQWFADVTYDRAAASALGRYVRLGQNYAGQRCHWYRIVKRSDAEPDPQVPGYRRITVITETAVAARTLLQDDPASGSTLPVYRNFALISPYVVNVFPKTFTIR